VSNLLPCLRVSVNLAYISSDCLELAQLTIQEIDPGSALSGMRKHTLGSDETIMTRRGSPDSQVWSQADHDVCCIARAVMASAAPGGASWIAELPLPTSLVEAGNAEQLILPWIANLRITARGSSGVEGTREHHVGRIRVTAGSKAGDATTVARMRTFSCRRTRNVMSVK
jgi:hypothetical protein